MRSVRISGRVRVHRVGAVLATCVLLGVTGCGKEANSPAGPGGWLTGDESEKFDTIAKQLRGLDVAMLEIGLRHRELYWAGQDRNWEYAAYQYKKIELALSNALVRRPKRTESSRVFLDAMPEMKAVIDGRDEAGFDQAFVNLTNRCNACHAMERVPFFTVRVPEERVSLVHARDSAEPEQAGTP